MTIFDEDDLVQLQEKALMICGTKMGFRGSKEHTFLTTDQIISGHFPKDHPDYPGMLWASVKYFSEDKVCKLSISKSHVRTMGEAMCRLPVFSDGKTGDVANDFGGPLLRLKAKLPQCKTDRLYHEVNAKTNTFCTEAVLGKDKILARCRSAYNHGTKRVHAMRSNFITDLSNDDGVSPIASASLAYQTTSTHSEAARLNALLSKSAVS